LQRTHAEAPFGLTNIFERAWLLQGDVSIQSQPGQGATVEVRIPIPMKQAEHGEDPSTCG